MASVCSGCKGLDIDAEDDPLHEDEMESCSNITHRYPDRALFPCNDHSADYTVDLYKKKKSPVIRFKFPENISNRIQISWATHWDKWRDLYLEMIR